MEDQGRSVSEGAAMRGPQTSSRFFVKQMVPEKHEIHPVGSASADLFNSSNLRNPPHESVG
jgi:hypothetical protein